MKKQIGTILMVLVLVSGCSWMPEMPSMSSLNPFGGEAKEEKVSEQIGVNPYLWQAALSKLSFMPLASADSKGGVIITEWASMDKMTNDQFKITVNILSRNLRADCLKVVVFKRVMRDGRWSEVEADKKLAGEIETAILTKARNLYRRDIAAREE